MEDEISEELEMLLHMFNDEVTRDPTYPMALVVSLPFRFVLHITLSPHTYPESHPSLFVAAGPNAALVSDFSARLLRAVREEVQLGGPMLLQIVTLAQNLAEELQEAHHAELMAAQEQMTVLQAEAELQLQEQEESAVVVWSGPCITDRKSRFMAHIARVGSEEDVRQVILHLRQQKHILEATHPTIYAYRFTDSAGVVHHDSEDDGETGASSRILFLLDQMKVNGYVVVVTRWFGGILLGPDRFKHIMEVVRNALLTIPQREAGDVVKEDGDRRVKAH